MIATWTARCTSLLRSPHSIRKLKDLQDQVNRGISNAWDDYMGPNDALFLAQVMDVVKKAKRDAEALGWAIGIRCLSRCGFRQADLVPGRVWRCR